ncbi:ATP-dependent DNA ligase [Nitrososphaera viennensis]|uniref:DNA ligase n=2 Tax=Nitrososphaera viennensis TaxID=1034015 RepID=A0A060HPC3_9ARCH|nr:ATP-dependent DNA ligase [Nitrososphaera viennensis]AIC15062.1 DNA ligase [Nitrososphaera viennensis EN76]UVS69991.1 ATP-dependent DNA ligase [Nitrososphaera viennensis]
MDFQPLVETFGKMEQTSSRLALTDHLVILLKQTPADLIDKVTYLIQGKLYPDYEGIEMGLAERMALRAIASSSGKSMSEVEAIYRKTGDIGDTAGKAMVSKGQSTLFSEQMTVERVYCTFDKIAKTTGPGSQETKLRLVASLLNDSTAEEGRYIMKFVMGALRLGIADYTVLDALAVAFTGDKANRKVLENAYNVSSDLGTVAKLLATKGLAAVKAVQITLFKPIRPMLAERVSTAEEAMERMDSRAAVEYKLDGERVQIHKGRDRIELFSRRLEKITDHYPDVSKAAMSLACKEAIMEGEVVAINLQTGEYLPFQQLMHRRRKHGIEEAMENYPVVINLFDILYLDGKSRTELPYEDRRKLLEKTVKGAKADGMMLKIVPQVIATEPGEIDRFMASAIESGCEGVMVKMPSSTYRAGAREYLWVKLKREYRTELADTLDLVIVGALHGRGRRVGKYGALLLAAYDPKEDIFRSVTKVGTGFTDVHLEQFYRELEKHVIHQKHARVDTGMDMEVWFEPAMVIEVIASEITLSPSHTAAMGAIKDGYGLALRFPKFTGKIRDDKEPEAATTTDEIVTMYRHQLKIHSEAAKSKEEEKEEE